MGRLTRPSTVKLRREVDEVFGNHVPRAFRLEVARLIGTVLGTAVDARGPEAEPTRGGEIVVVRGDHHALCGTETEKVGRDEIRLGIRLVVTRNLGAEHDVPGQSRAAGHVHDQRHVAIRERGEDVRAPEPREPGDGVGPRIESMPCAIQMVDLVRGQPTDAELAEQSLEAHPVEIVELRPRKRTRAHALHHRLIERAPGVRELRPVDTEAPGLAERFAFADDAAPPVDDGAEDVERERAYGLEGLTHAARHTYSRPRRAILRVPVKLVPSDHYDQSDARSEAGARALPTGVGREHRTLPP